MEDLLDKQGAHVNTLNAVESQAHKVHQQLQQLTQRVVEAEQTSQHVRDIPTTPRQLKQQQKHLTPFFKSLQRHPKKNQQLVKELEKLKQFLQVPLLLYCPRMIIS